MSEITLTRTGNRLLQFEGELIAETDSLATNGACENRYWELSLYRATSDKYVVAIGYRSAWAGEHDADDVYVCDDADSLSETVRAHQYDAGVTGYPPNQGEKQARLTAALGRCWNAAVTEILSHIEPERLE